MTLSPDILPWLISAVGLVAWFTRLEAKVAANSKDSDRIEKRQNLHEGKIAELDKRVMEKLNCIEKIVSNIEGRLSAKED